MQMSIKLKKSLTCQKQNKLIMINTFNRSSSLFQNLNVMLKKLNSVNKKMMNYVLK